jgi:hypothetical protein
VQPHSNPQPLSSNLAPHAKKHRSIPASPLTPPAEDEKHDAYNIDLIQAEIEELERLVQPPQLGP